MTSVQSDSQSNEGTGFQENQAKQQKKQAYW